MLSKQSSSSMNSWFQDIRIFLRIQAFQHVRHGQLVPTITRVVNQMTVHQPEQNFTRNGATITCVVL
jgi:hypothetical protein